MKKSTVVWVGLVVTLVAGIVVGRISLRPKDDGAPNQAARRYEVTEVIARIERECQHGVWRRTKEWEVIFHSLPKADLARLAAAVRRLVVNPAQEDLRSTLLACWAESDPGAAIAFAQGISDPVLREAGLRMILQAWIAADTDAAVAWISKLPPGATRNEAVHLAIPYVASRNPSAALALVELLPPGYRSSAYAAEQIADSVENGEPPIVDHVRSRAVRFHDPFNIESLKTPRSQARDPAVAKHAPANY